MYAIVETGGKQYRVKPGDTVAVERLTGEPGESLDLDRVLLVAGNGDKPRVGSPGVDGAIVRAEVVEHIRGEKIIIFRYKSKVRYRRKTGHRQSLTRLRITDILLDGASSLTPQVEAPVEVAEPVEESAAPRRRRAPAAASTAEEPATAADTAEAITDTDEESAPPKAEA
jgi:large subunit ribosomal protein L21